MKGVESSDIHVKIYIYEKNRKLSAKYFFESFLEAEDFKSV